MNGMGKKMNDKMRKYINKTVIKQTKKVVEEKIVIKPIQNILNESIVVHPNDKEMLYYYIEKPSNIVYTLTTYNDTYAENDRHVLISRKLGTANRTIVIFNNEFVEITDFIVDMCDEMGWFFITGVQEDTNTIKIEIIVQ
jgi:hypothetical protein